MKRAARIAALVAMITLVSGCLPIPNVHYFAPAVSGVVFRDGQPVEKAEVRVAAQLAAEPQIATTNKEGRFSLKPIREFRLRALLLGDELYSYTVNLVVDGESYDGYTQIGMGDAPKSLSLRCDLGQAVALHNLPVYCSEANGGP